MNGCFSKGVALFLAGALTVPATSALAAVNESIESAVHDLYESRFDASRQTLNVYSSIHPGDPLAYALKGATYLFAELDKSGALKRSFLTDDRKVAKGSTARPDPRTAEALDEAIREARKAARSVLVKQPNDSNALLALTIASGVERDHLALAEHKLRESYPFLRESQIYAIRLLKVDSTAYDAYLTKGFTEYVVAGLPFYVRWIMKVDGVSGTKDQGLNDLQIAARSGQYMKPFAQLLLAMCYLREKQEDKTEKLLAQLSAEYPGNPNFRAEWEKARDSLHHTGK